MTKQHERRQGTRTRIVEAAGALFRENGFHATSVDQIVTRADVAKGTFYQHFETKLDVVLAIGHAELGKVREKAIAKMEKSDDPLAAMQKHLEEAAAWFESNASIAEALVWYHFSRSVGEIDPPETSTRAFVERCVRRAHDLGRVRRDVDPAELAQLISGVYMQAVLGWSKMRGSKPRLRSWIRRFFDVLYHGILEPPR